MSSTRKFLRASGYAATGLIMGTLAREQNTADLFAIFTLASGVCVAGASCLTIGGFENLKEEKNLDKNALNLPERGGPHDQVPHEPNVQPNAEDSNPTTPEA